MMALVYTFGAGLFAFAVMCAALAATLDAEDRRSALQFLKHPIRGVFGSAETDD
jgi:hypothetical protein